MVICSGQGFDSHAGIGGRGSQGDPVHELSLGALIIKNRFSFLFFFWGGGGGYSSHFSGGQRGKNSCNYSDPYITCHSHFARQLGSLSWRAERRRPPTRCS